MGGFSSSPPSWGWGICTLPDAERTILVGMILNSVKSLHRLLVPERSLGPWSYLLTSYFLEWTHISFCEEARYFRSKVCGFFTTLTKITVSGIVDHTSESHQRPSPHTGIGGFQPGYLSWGITSKFHFLVTCLTYYIFLEVVSQYPRHRPVC